MFRIEGCLHVAREVEQRKRQLVLVGRLFTQSGVAGVSLDCMDIIEVILIQASISKGDDETVSGI